VLSCLGEQLQQLPLQWVGYFSTTGVYGNSNGNWVDETNEPQPTQLRSQKRLDCEQLWLNSGLPVQIMRLPGIYGPGRSPLAAVRSGELTPVDQPGQMFCRIHVDDLAGACWHLMHRAAAGQRPTVVNISDNKPASRLELQRFAAELLGCTLPKPIPFSEAQASMSPMALSFWADNRKVSNALLRDELGYTFLHPDYSSGLKDCFEAEGFNGMNPEPEAEP
jgi:nucleoside-diphosphate-sugar epimerase